MEVSVLFRFFFMGEFVRVRNYAFGVLGCYSFPSCEGWVCLGFNNDGFWHSGGGTWGFGFLSSMESILHGGQFEKGGRNGSGTFHHLRGMTNGGRRGPGGPLDSPSPVPILVLMY